MKKIQIHPQGFVPSHFRSEPCWYQCFRLIVSIPIDLSEHKELQKYEDKGVRAYYVSVERIKQLENGNVEWRMATSSDIGGLIPKFMTERSMDKYIAEVRVFLRKPLCNDQKTFPSRMFPISFIGSRRSRKLDPSWFPDSLTTFLINPCITCSWLFDLITAIKRALGSAQLQHMYESLATKDQVNSPSQLVTASFQTFTSCSLVPPKWSTNSLPKISGSLAMLSGRIIRSVASSSDLGSVLT